MKAGEPTATVFCPKCGKQCVRGTATVVINDTLNGKRETKPTYTCPTHGGTFMDTGHFIVDVEKIPE